MDGAGGRSRDRRVDRRCRSMDDSGARAETAVEVRLGERRARVRIAGIGRGRAAHHDGVASRGLSRPDSALAVLHPASETRAAMEHAGHLAVRARNRYRDSRHHHRHLGVFARQALPNRRCAGADSVFGGKTLARCPWLDLRACRRHLGVQRNALDGSVFLARRRREPAWRRGAFAPASRQRAACGF